MLWPILLQVVEIDFAHTSFKWSNSAKGNAGVTCIIVGLRNPSQNEKYIFSNSVRQSATNINPYLADGKKHNNTQTFETAVVCIAANELR